MRFVFNTFYSILLIIQILSFVITENIDSECPQRCRCIIENHGRHQVDCSRQNLTDIPPGSQWPKDVFSFDISMNRIKIIDLMESHEKLEYLDLASNQIERIEPNAFDHLPNLRGIDLSHNQLNTLPAKLFNENLFILNVSHNKIEFLPKELLENTVFLQELRLSHNPLRVLDPEFFSYTTQLRKLYLSAIDTYALRDDVFHKLLDLNELDLSDNDFMIVPTFPIRSARNIQALKLSGNPIRILDEHSFVKMSSLTELHLDDMKELIEIKPKTFSYLYNLKTISIANNPHLSYIDSHAFYGIFNRTWMAIKEVNFRANRLSTLPENTLPFCNLTSLDLRENPWTCDCHILWAKHCHLRPELSKGIICANPSRLRGHDLNLIDNHNLICEHNPVYRELRIMRLFIIIFVSFTLFFFGILFVLFIKRDSVIRWWTDKRRGTGAIYYVKAHTNPIEPEF
jgi:Leucine-rich repeat (LRR) protein